MSYGRARWSGIRAAGFAGMILLGCSDQQAAKIGDVTENSAKNAGQLLQQTARAIGAGAKKVKQGLDEAELTGKIYARLVWDKQLQQVKISIDSQPGGIVRLDGRVPSAALHQRVLEIAANTVGVREVIDAIEVEGALSSQPDPRTSGVRR